MAPTTAMASVARPAFRSLRPITICPSTTRTYAAASRSKIIREMDRATKMSNSKATKEQTMSEMQKFANAEYFKSGGGPLFPGTFVSLPLALIPKGPVTFASYQFNRFRGWLQGSLSVLSFKLKSMPTWTKRPKWKARRGKIAPTAKIMYREMLEAFAAGDKQAIARLCVGDFAKKLIAAIDRRSPKESVRFELVKYTKPMFYPRLMSHQMHNINPLDKTSTTEQAVIAIASQQQASRHNAATGEIVPGSLRVQDKIEYVVVTRQTSEEDFTSGPWKIWGTTVATTLEAHMHEKAVIEKEQIRRAGWDNKKE